MIFVVDGCIHLFRTLSFVFSMYRNLNPCNLSLSLSVTFALVVYHSIVCCFLISQELLLFVLLARLFRVFVIVLVYTPPGPAQHTVPRSHCDSHS